MPNETKLISPALPGPKARYPGQLMIALRAQPLNFLQSVVDRFGHRTQFRIGRARFFLFNDPDLTREVLVTQHESFQKSPVLRQAKVSLGEGLLTSEGDFHRRQRKLSQPAFHPHRVATYAQTMVRRSRQTADGWQDGSTVDLHEEMMRLTLRVVTETLFSTSIDDDLDEIGRSMSILVNMFGRARNPLAFILNRLPLPSNRRFLNAQAHVRRTVEWFILQNRMAGEERGDLLSTLVRARDTAGETAAASGTQTASGGMTDVQLRDEIVTLFAAGHETTANALTFTWWLLARHAEIADRLYEEIDRELPDRDPTADDLDRLPFTRAVVAESMRLYPPAWVLMRQATQDVKLAADTITVPKDAIVILSQWIAHRDSRWWKEPHKFDPDRWLDEAAKEERPRYAYFPFGGGVRSCIGESFAWAEAILIIATLARQWRMKLQSIEPLRLTPTITLRPRDPVWVTLRKRSAKSSL